MVVQHNLTAMNANRYLGINNSKLSKSLEKLSSGYAINRAGDNAAGLAVSEKMRSQIAGMTQAVKNAQDGISMVQTFEGALTETDSILQRMKTLADQMANGTYDDPVDRTAAQQEFLQLNDELDQIADTDFNGVVVLNGGVMSDGVKADANGLIDYRAAKANASTTTPVDVAKYTTTDRTTNEAAGAILDNSDYNADAANALWEKLGLSADDVKELNITFQKQGNEWKAVAATAGEAGKAATADTTIPGTAAQPATVTSSNAGVTVAIADATKITADVTLTYDAINGYSDGAGGNYATSGALSAALGVTFTGTPNAGDTITIKKAVAATPDTVVPGTPATEGSEKDITKEVIDKINALDITATPNGGFKFSWGDHDVNAVFGAYKAAEGDYLTLNFTNTADKSYAPTNIGVAEDSLEATVDANPNSPLSAVPEGTIKIALDAGITDDAMSQELSDALDELGTIEFSVAANGDITATGNNLITVDTDGTLKYNDADGNPQTLGTITVDTSKIDGWDATGTDTITFKVNVDDYKYVGDADVKANSIETSAVAKKAMEPFEVSKSDAFKNSETLMTYKESIILQAGARTKDAVEFTFKYNSDAIGDLAADLNCTAKGLGTDKLTLSTQKDANYAIDKIDQAINKVSLVRGTFGAIQNRLEHKIDNLNVSVENLTSAESQIRDTNMPQEMMNFTKQQILAQASQSMLAQANQLPQGVLSLLQ